MAQAAGVKRDDLPAADRRPYAPEGASCFPGPAIDAPALAEKLIGELERFAGERAENPFANPVLLLAHELSRRLEDGRLDYPALEQLVQHLTAEGYAERAARLGRYIGEVDEARNEDRLFDAFRALARPRRPDETGNERADIVRFELFRTRVESECFGIVVTAHPTFNLSTPLMRALAALATGRDADGRALGPEDRARLLDLARRAEHRPDADIGLAREHALSLEAIGNVLAALRRAYDILFRVASELYPKRWTELTPRLVTVASWVGYDLDGRSDIRWTDSLLKRLRVQHRQLEHYLDEVRSLRAAAGSRARDLRDTLDLMESRLALAITQATDEIGVFDRAEADEAHGR
ncbi:MAG TPA: hypothetical protein VFO41_07015, partial [Alphaproteobacteria bacterium]|nr:hypothetical protein [Alphaproteobacteria bacterium]